jgi:hypothetical protein
MKNFGHRRLRQSSLWNYISSCAPLVSKHLEQPERVWSACGRRETVLVTDRDRVVAEIGPPHPARSSMLSDALLLDAFRQGWMTPPISVGRGPPERKPVMTIDELLTDLDRDRADR